MQEIEEKQYARTTITVPRPLKRRMRTHGAGVNWSAVACDAFRMKLDQLQQKEQRRASTSSLSRAEAIERLRRLKQAAASDVDAENPRKQAKAAGRRWAMCDALPEELERLTALLEQDPQKPGAAAEGNHGPINPRRAMRRVAMAILDLPDRRGVKHREQITEFWQQRAGAEQIPPDIEWLTSFTKGAVQFWKNVREKL